jgi:hypothetical protein
MAGGSRRRDQEAVTRRHHRRQLVQQLGPRAARTFVEAGRARPRAARRCVGGGHHPAATPSRSMAGPHQLHAARDELLEHDPQRRDLVELARRQRGHTPRAAVRVRPALLRQPCERPRTGMCTRHFRRQRSLRQARPRRVDAGRRAAARDRLGQPGARSSSPRRRPNSSRTTVRIADVQRASAEFAPRSMTRIGRRRQPPAASSRATSSSSLSSTATHAKPTSAGRDRCRPPGGEMEQLDARPGRRTPGGACGRRRARRSPRSSRRATLVDHRLHAAHRARTRGAVEVETVIRRGAGRHGRELLWWR